MQNSDEMRVQRDHSYVIDREHDSYKNESLVDDDGIFTTCDYVVITLGISLPSSWFMVMYADAPWLSRPSAH